MSRNDPPSTPPPSPPRRRTGQNNNTPGAYLRRLEGPQHVVDPYDPQLRDDNIVRTPPRQQQQTTAPPAPRARQAGQRDVDDVPLFLIPPGNFESRGGRTNREGSMVGRTSPTQEQIRRRSPVGQLQANDPRREQIDELENTLVWLNHRRRQVLRQLEALQGIRRRSQLRTTGLVESPSDFRNELFKPLIQF
jgi:hypothetical protein